MATLPGPDSAASKLNKLMARVYAPIVAAAFTHGLAVIDLPNTFDARNHHLYVAAFARVAIVFVNLMSPNLIFF